MGPHVVGEKEEPVLESPPRIELKNMKGAVSDVSAPADRTECRVRRKTRTRVQQIHISGGKNIRSFVPEVTNRPQDLERQLLLNPRSPGRDIVIFSIAVQVARRDDAQAAGFSILEKTRQRKRQIGESGVAKGIALHGIRYRKVLIVFLTIGVVNSASGAQYGVAMRPGQTKPRVDVVVSEMKERIGAGAVTAAGTEIEGNVVIADGMERVEEAVADAGCNGEIRSGLPLVLNIAEVLCLALPDQRQDSSIGRESIFLFRKAEVEV
jgi:hypothetical protein